MTDTGTCVWCEGSTCEEVCRVADADCPSRRKTSDHAVAERNLVAEFRSYAEHPIKGSEFVPIHQDTLRQAANEMEEMRRALSEIAVKASQCRGEQSYRDTMHFAERRARKALGKRGIER